VNQSSKKRNDWPVSELRSWHTLKGTQCFKDAADEIELLRGPGNPSQLALDMATKPLDDEIARLTAQCESLQNRWASRPLDHPNGEALIAENKQLRIALRRANAALVRQGLSEMQVDLGEGRLSGVTLEKDDGGMVPSDDLQACAHEVLRLEDKVAALQKFKDFVHARPDQAGVEKDPPGQHRDAGCRIGQRLDLVLGVSGACSLVDEQIAAAAAFIMDESFGDPPASSPLETSALCPHGFVLAENTCGPCSEGRPNRKRS